MGQFAGHLGPFTSMMMWPISAAAPLAPRRGRPPLMMPPPTPVPSVSIEHVAGAHAGAVEVLADAGGRGVVVDHDGDAEAPFEVIAQRHVGERQVDRLDDAPAGEVDHGGDPHADALHPSEPCSRSARQASTPRRQASAEVGVGERGEPVDDLRRLHLGARARAGLGQTPAHECRGDLGAADVDADDGAFRGHDVPQLTMV